MNLALGYYQSPIGWLRITAEDQAIVGLDFVDRCSELEDDIPVLTLCKQQLSEYFSGHLTTFQVPIALRGSLFQQKVWDQVQLIPYGSTCSYSMVACHIGTPKAYRAVGGANNRNPILILVPCHRVVGAYGQLVGYAGGLEKKEWLLAHEAQHAVVL